MSKRTTMRRMISITPELDKKLKEHPDVNWSGIAFNAFVAYLDEINNVPTKESIKRRMEKIQEQLTELCRDVRELQDE